MGVLACAVGGKGNVHYVVALVGVFAFKKLDRAVGGNRPLAACHASKYEEHGNIVAIGCGHRLYNAVKLFVKGGKVVVVAFLVSAL